MKYILLISIFFLLDFDAYSQKGIKIKISKKGCLVRLVFKNLSNRPVIIPDFSLRTENVNQTSVIRNEYLHVSNDTLTINVHRKITGTKMIVLDQDKGSNELFYNDFSLDKKQIQTFFLPSCGCNTQISFIRILYNNELLVIRKV